MDVESGKKPNMLKFNMLFFSQTYNKVLTCFHVFLPKMGRPTRTQFPSKKWCEVHTYASNTWYNLAIHKMMVRHTSLFLMHSENEGCEDQNLGAPTVCHQEVMGAGCTWYPSSSCTVVQHSDIGYFSTLMVGFHHRQGNKVTSTCASKCSEHKWITLSSEYNWIHVPTCLKPL